jgi:hypothetical protein
MPYLGARRVDSIHVSGNQDFSGVQADEWYFVDADGKKVGDKPVYAQKYICFNPLVFNKDLIDNPPIDDAEEIQAEAQSLIKKTKDTGDFKPDELQIEKQETVDFKHITKNPGPDWAEAEWKIYEINKTAKTQEQLNSEGEPIAEIGTEIAKGAVKGDKLKKDASEEHTPAKSTKVKTSHLGEKDRLCQVIVIVAKNAAGQAVAAGDWVCATPDSNVGGGCVDSATWATMSEEDKAGKTECPPEDPVEPEDPDTPDPDDVPTTTASSGSKIELPPYTLLTEVRNMTKDAGTEDWKNWMYEYDYISIPDNKGLKNDSSLNVPAATTSYNCGGLTGVGMAMGAAIAANLASPGSVSISGSCPPNRYDYFYTVEYGGNSSGRVTTIGNPPKIRANSSPKSTKPKAEPKDYVLAKPTDFIQFRHTVEKGWWGVTADNGKTAPSNTTNPSSPAVAERCTITHTLPSGETESGTYVRKETREENSFRKTYSCVGGDWNTEEKQANKIPGDTDDFPESGYEVRTKKSGLLNIKKDDVGKIFEEKIETYPTWAYEDEYQCQNEINKKTSLSGATIGGVQFKTQDTGVWCGTPNADVDGQTTSVKQGGNGVSSARAYVPYNYDNRPITTATPRGGTDCSYPESRDADADAGCQGDDVPADKKGWPNYGLVYAGENFSFNSHIIVNPRNNPDVDADAPYATYTKPTKYQIVSFATRPDSNKPKGYGVGTVDPCAYYSSAAPADASGYAGMVSKPASRDCVVLSNSIADKVYNEHGDLEGIKNHLEGTDVIIDDLPVGSKICFAAAVFPADSHDKPENADLPTGETGNIEGGAAMRETGAKWAYGAPYCVTIAKKPNFQVWGSGVYTASGLNTSQSPKLLLSSNDPVLASSANPLLQNGIGNGSRTVFGSWSEWEVVSLGPVNGFGSGAVFGYETPAAGYTARAVTYPGGLDGFGGNNAGDKSATLCATSKMTLGNNNCASLPIPGPLGALLPGGSVGNADVQFTTMTTTLMTQLSARYTGSGHGPSEANRNAFHIDYMTALPDADVTVPKGRVFVYDLRSLGKVTLEHNIKYTEGPYAAISELPQVLIFANDLDIAANVTHIDAWIILDGDGVVTGNGTLNTCPDEVTGAADCINPLTINGPVYANAILLNRTYGAFPGTGNAPTHSQVGNAPCETTNAGGQYVVDSWCQADAWPNGWKGSIAPAERFVLRIDTFWWAYAQANITPKAVTVHEYEPSVNF